MGAQRSAPNGPGSGQRTVLGEPIIAWIALLAGVIAVCGHSATAYSIPVMMKSITADLGWTRGQFAEAQATRTVGIAISGLVWGLLTDRIGARAVLVAGAILCALGLAGFAAMRSITDLYLTGVAVGVGVGGLGPVAASALVARMFGPRRGVALGALHAGDNLLTSFLPATTARLAANLGWRGATAVFAAGYVVIAAIVLLFLPRRAGHSPAPSRVVVALGRLPLRDPGLAFIAVSFVVAYAYIGALIYHFVAYQTDLGLPESLATRVMGNVVLAGFAGALSAGWIVERIGASRTLVLFHVILALPSFALWLAPTEATFRVWPWAHGVAMGAYAPLLPLVLAERYGAEAPDLGTIIGVVSLLALCGAYLGNLAGGLVHDATGTYVVAWQAFSVVLVLSLAMPLRLVARPVVP